MDLSRWPVFISGLFRQAKFLVTAPPKAQSALEILETGVVGIESFPMEGTGFINAVNPEVKKSWACIHALKVELYHNGQPMNKSAVLPISERSYKPLDPFGILKTKESDKMASLPEIAKTRHAQARSNAKAENTQKDLAAMIIQGGFFVLALMYVLSMARGCGSG